MTQSKLFPSKPYLKGFVVSTSRLLEPGVRKMVDELSKELHIPLRVEISDADFGCVLRIMIHSNQYSIGCVITREMIDDDQYQTIERMVKNCVQELFIKSQGIVIPVNEIIAELRKDYGKSQGM